MSILQTPWPAFFVKAGIFESVDNIVSTTTRRDTKKPMARFVNEYLIQGVGVDCTSAGCRSGSGISGRRLEVELLAGKSWSGEGAMLHEEYAISTYPTAFFHCVKRALPFNN